MRSFMLFEWQSCLTSSNNSQSRKFLDFYDSPLICGANQWTGFYMVAASVMKDLNFFPKELSIQEIPYVFSWLFIIIMIRILIGYYYRIHSEINFFFLQNYLGLCTRKKIHYVVSQWMEFTRLLSSMIFKGMVVCSITARNICGNFFMLRSKDIL